MRAVIQRVTHASVTIEGQIKGKIDNGYLILLGVCEEDSMEDVEWLVKKIANLRIFADDEDKMNLSILNVKGSILLVSQFTLCALTRHGNRPAFTEAMPPEEADRMYQAFGKMLETQGIPVQYGQFGAMMDVALINDGPVTIILESKNGAILR